MTREEAIKEIEKVFEPAFANYIVEALTKGATVSEQEPKSEWERDHEILKAYSNGANEVLDKIRAEIKDWQTDIHDNEYDADKYDFAFERIFEIIDEYKAKSEEK